MAQFGNNAGNRVRGYLEEVLGLSPADCRAVGIGLQASLSSTTPGTDTYQVPSDQDFIGFSIQGYLGFSALATEPTSGILSYLNPDPSERWFMKSQNCTVQLENTDRSYEVFDARELRLSAISPPCGSPLYFPDVAPYLVPAGHRLRATFTLQDSTTAIVGNATTYGILLGGVLIPAAKKK